MGLDLGYALSRGIIGAASAVNSTAEDQIRQNAAIEAEKRAADRRLADHERILAMNEVAAQRAEERKIATNRARGAEVDAAVQGRVKADRLNELRSLYENPDLQESDVADAEWQGTSSPSRADLARYGAEEAGKRGFEDMEKNKRGILQAEIQDERYKAETTRKSAADEARAEARMREAEIKEKLADMKASVAEARQSARDANKDLPASVKAQIDVVSGRIKALETEAAKLLTTPTGTFETPEQKSARERARVDIEQRINGLMSDVASLTDGKPVMPRAPAPQAKPALAGAGLELPKISDKTPQPPPSVGTEIGGYVFQGGNPKDKNNWKPKGN